MIQVKNIDTESNTWGGVFINADDSYNCQSLNEQLKFSLSDIFVNALATGKAEVYIDGVKSSSVSASLYALNGELQKTSKGIRKVAAYEPEGVGATIVSVNFADRCSWYMGAIQVVAGSLSNTGLIYSDPDSKTHWIDLEHGRLYDEDNVMLASANAYRVMVYVDAVPVTTGYTINYELGTVTFDDTPSGAVTASYWYADKSWFKVRPNAGKILSIKAAEVQFSKNTTMTESGAFIFGPWFVDHPVYGTMQIPGQQIAYKNFRDFVSACNQGQGLIPSIGDLPDVHVFPFNYARPKPIKYSDYIEIRVYCANHVACGGEYATSTFYVTIEDE